MSAKTTTSALIVTLLALTLAGTAHASFVGYTNSLDWQADVITAGLTTNTDIDFETHAVGALNPNHYLASNGITLTPDGTTGNFDDVRFGAGPGDTNTTTFPRSTGEGLHTESNYLQNWATQGTLTIDFDRAVAGVGLFAIDYFAPWPPSPSGAHPNALELTAFDSSGTVLGAAEAPDLNFQTNYMNFLGVRSDSEDISYVELYFDSGGAYDNIGVDDIRYAYDASAPPPPVPEPASCALLALGVGGVGTMLRKRRKK